MIVAVWQLGWRKSLPAATALAAGACLFGIPYVFCFLLPNRQLIETAVQSSQGSGGIPAAVGMHLRLYRTWAQGTQVEPLMRLVLGTGVPLMVFSTAILGMIPVLT